MSPPEKPDVNTLRLIYEHQVRERDRLRDARRTVTAQLGPLPASAGLVIGLFAGLSPNVENRGLWWAALALFLGVIAVSVGSSRVDPYRRAAAEVDEPRGEGLQPGDLLAEEEWLATRIEIERRLYYGEAGEAPPRGLRRLSPSRGSLQASFDLELAGLRMVQALLAAEVVLLVLTRLL
jgi:hypothetical protein